MNKIIGYVCAGVGLVSLALGTGNKMTANMGIPIISKIPSLYLTAAGVILVFVGITLMIKGSSGKQLKEVPIYEGKNIVGYRRHK
ncbi:MAG: hypothetical protein ACP5OG_01420 [Candidatus Nanoarchaeia archaeon]